MRHYPDPWRQAQARPEPRIGDAEREAAVSALSDHFVAGRLTKLEYDDRCTAAWQARTATDLAPLFADLPAAGQRAATHWAAPRGAGRDASSGRAPRLPLLPLLLVFLGLAMLTDFWVMVIVVGLLWWSGGFRWLAQATSGRARRSGERQ